MLVMNWFCSSLLTNSIKLPSVMRKNMETRTKKKPSDIKYGRGFFIKLCSIPLRASLALGGVIIYIQHEASVIMLGSAHSRNSFPGFCCKASEAIVKSSLIRPKQLPDPIKLLLVRTVKVTN